MNKIKLILIGAGQRGAEAYASYVFDNPGEAELVGVADPRADRREAVAQRYGIPAENVFADWQDILAREKFADGVILATQDTMHYAPALQAMERGYHVLCEKPMSPNARECAEMGKAAQAYGRVLAICHVLRYTPFFMEIKSIIDAGHIGEIVAIQLTENVAHWHQAHSYVRGSWSNTAKSSPMILAKSCHDMDVLLWLMGRHCTQVSSFGGLSHFKAENAPEGAPARCLDGCPARDTCPYYAPRIYIDWNNDWQASVIRKVVSLDTSRDRLMKALQTGPYGRCVYHCDNDVVDHQIVNLDFEGGAVASFTMCGFTVEEGRTIKVMGTKGEIRGWADDNRIEYATYLEKAPRTVVLNPEGGHMGGDNRIMKDFLQQIAADGKVQGRTSAAVSVESHMVALAAEQSRLQNRTVQLQDFVARL